ncbi:tetratricopeptide repeat protein [Candidatus Peregrinibacteria bacterium]|nr:tetratricopeptide repeat protein [Candidatus Peregrinibacteria bacterium]MBI3816735.1 tetratricopeptide repeat protein [Candidatus Peregrinibacteria bacterium]
MKLRARIVVPVLAALAVAVSLMTFLRWQVVSTADSLRRTIERQAQTTGAPSAANAPKSDATAIESDQALLHLHKGDVLALQGDWPSAEAEYQQAAHAQGGIPALKKLAQAELQRREFTAAQTTLVTLGQQGARSEDLLLLQILMALHRGDRTTVQTLLNQAAESPQKHYGAALLAIVQGRSDDAKTELQAVENGWEPGLREYARTLRGAYDEYALFPESKEIHLQTLLARALAQAQECELALPMLTSVVHQADDYRDAWIVKGFCELTMERPSDALASLERAYALDPEKPETQYFLGRSYAALKDGKNAMTFFEYALKNGFTPEKEVRRALAAEAQEAGDAALALEQEQAMMQASDAELADFEGFISLALAAGKHDDAFAAAQQAAKKWPDSAEAQELYGLTAQAANHREEAIAALRHALELDPTRQRSADALKKML